jgi:hypothetical protein
MRTMPVNVRLELVSADESKELDFCLYRYREQVSGGSLRLTMDGDIVAHLSNYSQLGRQGETK